ncbi:MAG: hypothetical protein ABI625_01230 [bacterium]
MSARTQWLRLTSGANALRVVVLLGLTAPLVHAQGKPAARRDPVDARAVVPPVIHVSIPLVRADTSDEQRIPWKVANDEVACIGGWREYARESRPTPTSATPGRAPQSKTLQATCTDHRDPPRLEREGRTDAR